MRSSPIWLQQEADLKSADSLTEHHRSKRLLVAMDIAVGIRLIENGAAYSRVA